MSISGSQQGPGDSTPLASYGKTTGQRGQLMGHPAGLGIPREWDPGVLGSRTVHSSGLVQAGREAGTSSAAAQHSLT